jgi:aminoglycoside 6-adenylyltransferase
MDRRTEKEMTDLIFEFAQEHDVKMIGQEGSRNNPRKPADAFQDFDITYFVEDLTPFYKINWVQAFGEIVVSQSVPENPGINQMMQFEDGNRIDLDIRLTSYVEEYLASDTLNTIIYGGKTRETTDETHRVTAPTHQEVANAVIEFYWVSLYVAKGIKREELIYAATTFEMIRAELFKMAVWARFVGKNPGKFCSRVGEVLFDVSIYYKLSTLENIQNALFFAVIEMKELIPLVTDSPFPEVDKTIQYLLKLFPEVE